MDPVGRGHAGSMTPAAAFVSAPRGTHCHHRDRGWPSPPPIDGIFTRRYLLAPVVSPALTQAVSFTLIAVVAAFVGGGISIYYSPGPYGESYIQHFSAGVVFAAVAAKLLPDVHDRAPEFVVVGFAIGVATMLLIHQGSRLLEQSGIGGGFAGVTSLLGTVSTNMVIDGLLIGVAFLSAPKTGVIITLALAVETLFIGATAVAVLPDRLSPHEKLVVPFLFGGLLLVGVTGGTILFGDVTGAPIAIVLAFGAANLIYLVTEELLVKAQQVPETPTSTVLFFAGFLLIFVFDMLY